MNTPHLECPVPLSYRTEITVGHGGGGKLTQELIDTIFRPAFANDALESQHDGAVMPFAKKRMAFTTDSHVVSPLFFPGGDIGSLAVNGTINDLLMCGARPLWMSAGFILEEGLSLETLDKIVKSMAKTAKESGVSIVTGDTKVVERGKGDSIYVTTAGIGIIEHNHIIGPYSIKEGDVIIVNGDIGRHGMAIMASREGLEFESTIQSDCASLLKPVEALLNSGITLHCMRDLTRGGLATTLVELAQTSKCLFTLNEASIPVTDLVRGACEILGFEPMYVANEGRFACIVPEKDADKALAILNEVAPELCPAVIGKVGPKDRGVVYLTSIIGTERVLDRLSGEQLPRIC